LRLASARPAYDPPVSQASTTVKRALGAGLKASAAAADRLRPPPSGIVFLIYHRIGGRTASNVDLPTSLFAEQVEELASAGRIVSIDDAVAAFHDGDPVHGPAPVVLTFDDGTSDWVDEALPVLARFDAPATFFVATDFVERQVAFPGGGNPISWAGLSELKASGLATIGSHTHTHALLDRADRPTAAAELDRSVGLLGERLGVACDHFAYPKALLGSPAAEDEVRQRFGSAAIAGTRANDPAHTDPFRIARTPIQVTDGMRWFRHKAAGGMVLEDRARAVLNRGRYSGATT
jgi:peptidoglycan/xylan/chitin deacetylase (PgdA/CDA1 family)